MKFANSNCSGPLNDLSSVPLLQENIVQRLKKLEDPIEDSDQIRNCLQRFVNVTNKSVERLDELLRLAEPDRKLTRRLRVVERCLARQLDIVQCCLKSDEGLLE